MRNGCISWQTIILILAVAFCVGEIWDVIAEKVYERKAQIRIEDYE
jgi:hypothetical protein